MAIMIPAECDLSRRPISEQIVFKAIQENLSDEWKVFHSFDYLTRDLNAQIWDGEIDFLLYHPYCGLLILEVKGGAISYRQGQWYQNDHPINPVEQAKHNKYAVMNLLHDQLHRDIPLKFAHAVCFPSCSNETVWPIEARDIVLTKYQLPFIESFACHLLEKAPLPSYLNGSITEAEVLSVLDPVFEYGAKLGDRMAEDEQQFLKFTAEQLHILQACRNFKKLQIKGCAGSGKTIMAVKKAQQLAAENKKVLLICFNQLLAQKLKKATQSSGQITADAFFEYCIDLMQLPQDQVDQYRDNPRLYTNVLPTLLKKYIYHTNLYYDAIIVDEGQDFTHAVWEVLKLLLVDDGYFYIFYDPDQNIYHDQLELPDFGLPPLELTQNCRNTKHIFQEMASLGTLAQEINPAAPQGAEVRHLYGNCRTNLAAELFRLVYEENVKVQDIVILGAHAFYHLDLAGTSQVGRFKIFPGQAQGKDTISYYTYMKYKGCEARVVILYQVAENDPRWSDHRGLYTAMSRAVHQLIVLHQ